MLFCDSFSILPPAEISPKCKTMALSLWPVSHCPLRSSLKSLSKENCLNTKELENISVLALFSPIETINVSIPDENFDFPVEQFKKAFKPEGFLHPVNLPSGRGVCFLLNGISSSCISRSRCISFTQVVNARPIQGPQANNCERVFELFPVATKLSMRFPFTAPPFTQSSFIPIKKASFSIVPEPNIPPKQLNWDKAAKLERWKWHLSKVTDGIYISGAAVAANGNLLRRNGITHIINACSQVCQSAEGFETLSFQLLDGGDENILSSVWASTSFIQKALQKRGKVLVHCQEGVSRSTALLIGYFIITERLDYQTAFKRIRSARHIASPNPRFIAQLMQLTEVLGSATSSTCFYSREKLLPFEVIRRNNGLFGVPKPEMPPESTEDRVFVVIDFRNGGKISLCDRGRRGDAFILCGERSDPAFVECGERLLEDLRSCLRVGPGSEDDEVGEEDYSEFEEEDFGEEDL